MRMRTPEDKYLNDPAYKVLVDSIHSMLNYAQFTPSEVREAAVYACIRYEMHRPAIYTTIHKEDVT